MQCSGFGRWRLRLRSGACYPLVNTGVYGLLLACLGKDATPLMAEDSSLRDIFCMFNLTEARASTLMNYLPNLTVLAGTYLP